MKMNSYFAYAVIAVAICAPFSVMIIATTKNDNESFDNIMIKGVVIKIEKNSGRYNIYYRVIDVLAQDSLIFKNIVGTKSYVNLTEKTYDVNDTINHIVEILKNK
jgi:hypothetical protein